MKPKQILTDLMLLEGQLNNFSFEELTMEEASQLKESFMIFKNRLEEKVNGVRLTEVGPTLDLGTIGSHKVADPIDSESLLAKLQDGLRAPINGILGYTDQILEGEMDREQRARIGTVNKMANDLAGILNELQEYLELATGKGKFEKVDFNLSRVVRDTLFLCNALIVHKEVKLSVDIDEKVPPFLIGDPSRLSQVLLYFFGNIIKLVNKGNIHLRIVLKEDLGATCSLQFQISHPGTGKVRADLERFYGSLARSGTPDPESFSEGGLGMDIIKQLIANLNGSIQVARTIGPETGLLFFLPYTRGAGTKRDNQNGSDDLDLARKGIKGMRLLVFEGDPTNQRVLKRCLEKYGMAVEVTDNGPSGLEYLRKNKVDLVMLDLQIKSINGFWIAKSIRESHSPKIKGLPIIGLTANCSPQDKVMAKEYGIEDVVIRPYDFDEIVLTIYKNRGSMPKVVLGPGPITVPDCPHLEKIWAECSGEIDLLEEMIGLFKRNILEYVGKLKIYLPLGEFEKIQTATQKVRASACLMRADTLMPIIDSIMTNCRTVRDIHYLNMLYDQFLSTYPSLETAIDTELNLLKNLGRP